jgi:hypothetical protein
VNWVGPLFAFETATRRWRLTECFVDCEEMANRRKQIVDRTQGDGQARTLSNLNINTRYLDPGYDIVRQDLVRGETGLLKVFSLLPRNPAQPSFEARVDDGSPGRRRDPELDFDIKGVSEVVQNDFKPSRNQYVGHHTSKSPNPNQRIFDVQIATPLGKVFDGEVSFNVAFSVSMAMTVTSNMICHAIVIRAPFRTRVLNRMLSLLRNIRIAAAKLFEQLVQAGPRIRLLWKTFHSASHRPNALRARSIFAALHESTIGPKRT